MATMHVNLCELVVRYPKLRTGWFCWSKVLLPTWPCLTSLAVILSLSRGRATMQKTVIPRPTRGMITEPDICGGSPVLRWMVVNYFLRSVDYPGSACEWWRADLIDTVSSSNHCRLTWLRRARKCPIFFLFLWLWYKRSVISSAKQKSSCSNGIVSLELDVEPDDETIIYAESCDESVSLSSDEFSSVSDATETDSARVWCKVDPKQLLAAPPQFPFCIIVTFSTEVKTSHNMKELFVTCTDNEYNFQDTPKEKK